MSTFIKINSQASGPFTDAELRQKLATGNITAQTPAWRMGMPEWTTVGVLFPVSAPPPVSPRTPPPIPGAGSREGQEMSFREAMATVNAFLDNAPDEPQPDAIERVQALAEDFLCTLRGRLGRTARPEQLAFFAHRTVTTAIQRVRLDVLKGATLTPQGEEFLAKAAAYLACVAVHNWQRRGLEVFGRVQFEPGGARNEILFAAERMRNGQHEVYAHQFLGDMFEQLLRPKQAFPTMHGRFYMLSSLTLPSPEQLYLYGACLMHSSHARGTWPKGERVGGLDEDFTQSKQLLVDDLHADCGLPLEDEALRKLSLWIVFPPYGWDMNDGNDYNFMTVFDQISHKQIVSRETGIDYLRALLQCQAVDIRNLAARCLMVYRVPPRDWQEACFYQQAMASSDYDVARASMAKYQHQLEKVTLTPEWQEEVERERRSWVTPAITQPWQTTPLFTDADYIKLGKLPQELASEGPRIVEMLLKRHPNDWNIRTIHASLQMQAGDARGEQTLWQLIREPFREGDEAHLRFGTLLKRQGRREEAMQVFEDAVKRWPWHHRAVDSCLWLITDGMTRFPEAAP